MLKKNIYLELRKEDEYVFNYLIHFKDISFVGFNDNGTNADVILYQNWLCAHFSEMLEIGLLYFE